MSQTIFDDVFRTIIENLPQLAVPLINEVFRKNYPEDIEIRQLRNENQGEDGKTITDSRLEIGQKIYHIECQSTDDTTMAERMIRYDFRIGMERSQRRKRKYYLEFPRSCVVYLRETQATPDELEVLLETSNGSCQYCVPVVKTVRYGMTELFQKNLQMLLPFYIIRYEERADELEKDAQKLDELKKEYKEIIEHLEKKYIEGGSPELYTDITGLMRRVIEYVFQKNEKIKKGLSEVMGGKVLQLESERLREEGRAKGKAEERMLVKSIYQQKKRNPDSTIGEISKKVNCKEEEVEEILKIFEI